MGYIILMRATLKRCFVFIVRHVKCQHFSKQDFLYCQDSNCESLIEIYTGTNLVSLVTIFLSSSNTIFCI